jgi:AcrR family transcriptional regulator
MRNYQRARSKTEKVYREDSILTVAEILLRHSGYDAMAMQKVATLANLTKGTLYLYFDTREELIFIVYQRLFDQWTERFELYQPENTSIDVFIRAFGLYYVSDPLFTQLVGLASPIQEQKITHHAYVRS